LTIFNEDDDDDDDDDDNNARRDRTRLLGMRGNTVTLNCTRCRPTSDSAESHVVLLPTR